MQGQGKEKFNIVFSNTCHIVENQGGPRVQVEDLLVTGLIDNQSAIEDPELIIYPMDTNYCLIGK